MYYEALKKRGLNKLNEELLKEAYQIRDFDLEGQLWSKKRYVGGYTSYSSMDQLHQFSSTLMELERAISAHVQIFAKHLEMDLQGGTLGMSNCWLNIMPAQTSHSLHIHPNSVISGTYYLQTPRGCSGIRFEDPRLDNFMAAPPKQDRCSRKNKQSALLRAKAGHLVLFESWLRHEVPASPVDKDRISISFNYSWD